MPWKRIFLLDPTDFVRFGFLVLACKYHYIYGQKNGQQDPRNDTAQEHGRYGNTGHDQGVDDHRNTRWDNGADNRGSGGNRGRKITRVAPLFHLRNEDPSNGGGVRNRGAGQPCKNNRGPDIDHGQTCTQPADENVGEGNDPTGDARFIHQLTGENEQGDGQQRIGPYPAEHLGGNDTKVGREIRRPP